MAGCQFCFKAPCKLAHRTKGEELFIVFGILSMVIATILSCAGADWLSDVALFFYVSAVVCTLFGLVPRGVDTASQSE